MLFRLILSLLLIASSMNSFAGLMIGTGMSKVTQGRMVPLFYIGADNGDNVINFSSIGVKTEIYYHSAYRFSYYHQSSFGSNELAEQRVGFGIGGLYSVRGYREDKNSEEESVTDFIVGPGFRYCLDFGDTFFISLETMYGVSNLMLLVLSFQNTNSINFGARF